MSISLALLALILLGGVLYTATHYALFTAQTGLMVSLELLGALPGAAVCGWIGWRIWRRHAPLWQGLAVWSVYTLIAAVRLTLFARADYDRQRLPLVWAAAAALLLCTLALSIRDRRTRSVKENINHGFEP
jgi:hypothetical protein